MAPLTDALPTATSTQVPSPRLSDEEVLDPNGQDMSTSDTPDRPPYYERQLGESEVSYYLQSRATGVNDMYLHLGFRSPMRLVLRPRVRAAWAILRLRHPLLASHVVMRNYDDIKFVFRPPTSPEDALAGADSQLDYRHQNKDALIDSYLNGPRTLNNERLSYLVVCHTPTPDVQLPSPPLTPRISADVSADQAAHITSDDRVFNHELLICATHFIGDGMALHQFANDFFGLLNSAFSQQELDQLVADEWKQRWGQTRPDTAIPASVEENWGTEQNRFRRAGGIIDFQNNLDRQIAMIKKCKSQGVSISSAMFAICNIAWARTGRGKQELPMMMYAPINIRPYLPKPTGDSYWFLSVGYFNIIFPNFIPASCDVSKTREMAIKRGKQARLWAKEDDEKEAGVWVPPPPTSDTAPPPRAPSIALTGLSLLGNLDGMYKHAKFPDIKLHTLTTGSRQRNGAMLMFSYTFAGKLWISLGYDENGFERDTVDLFWKNVDAAIREFLI
ncbi:hypothetical protein BJV77DRAFT_1063101 [Russula vinacea]|nr:hypothetical protein BJV77DRAFT_1063101 [Russula vinacea]